MSMSVYIKGLRPVTNEYIKKLEIYEACNELDITPPEELSEYFDYDEHPCEDGILIDIPGDFIEHDTSFHHASEYYDVDLTKLPDGVTKLRFVMSY